MFIIISFSANIIGSKGKKLAWKSPFLSPHLALRLSELISNIPLPGGEGVGWLSIVPKSLSLWERVVRNGFH
jgi:hypothetical protein